jgi:hypothetical protein
MTPAARELFRREQGAMFDGVAKTPERAAQLRAYAETALARAPAGFTAGLRKSGALDDASILMNLALHGERTALRRQMRSPPQPSLIGRQSMQTDNKSALRALVNGNENDLGPRFPIIP